MEFRFLIKAQKKPPYYVPLKKHLRAILAWQTLRCTRAGVTVDTIDIDELIAAIQAQRWCVYCPADIRERFHIDHKIPIAKGGGHTRDNIQILCDWCNISKQHRAHPSRTQPKVSFDYLPAEPLDWDTDY